jgi:hypothetical protein
MFNNLIPLCRLFGQLLILHTLEHSSVPELHRLVPDGYDLWCEFALGYIEKCAPSSPIVAREYDIAAALLRIKRPNCSSVAR